MLFTLQVHSRCVNEAFVGERTFQMGLLQVTLLIISISINTDTHCDMLESVLSHIYNVSVKLLNGEFILTRVLHMVSVSKM